MTLIEELVGMPTEPLHLSYEKYEKKKDEKNEVNKQHEEDALQTDGNAEILKHPLVKGSF